MRTNTVEGEIKTFDSLLKKVQEVNKLSSEINWANYVSLALADSTHGRLVDSIHVYSGIAKLATKYEKELTIDKDRFEDWWEYSFVIDGIKIFQLDKETDNWEELK